MQHVQHEHIMDGIQSSPAEFKIKGIGMRNAEGELVKAVGYEWNEFG
jgi:hypothetical protein